MKTLLLCFVMVVLLPVQSFAQTTQLQIVPDDILNELRSRDLPENCSVQYFYESMYVPIRISLQHDSTGVFDYKSEPLNDKTLHHMQIATPTLNNIEFYTNDTDTFFTYVKLDFPNYDLTAPKHVFYQFQIQDNIVKERGTWIQDGLSFCKVMIISTSEAPHIPTEDEMVERVKNGVATQLRDNNEGLRQVSGLIYVAVTFSVIVAIIMILQSLFNIFMKMRENKSTKGLAQRLVNAESSFKNAIDKINTTKEYLEANQIVMQHRNNDEMKNTIMNFSKSLELTVQTLLLGVETIIKATPKNTQEIIQPHTTKEEQNEKQKPESKPIATLESVLPFDVMDLKDKSIQLTKEMISKTPLKKIIPTKEEKSKDDLFKEELKKLNYETLSNEFSKARLDSINNPLDEEKRKKMQMIYEEMVNRK